jgi:hypothetical protein
MITLNFDILDLLFDCYELDMLDGHVQTIAELLKEGHSISLYKKLPNREREVFIVLNNLADLQEMLKVHFRGWQPTEAYAYI